MASIVPKCWLEWNLGTDGEALPRFPEIGLLAAHDPGTATYPPREPLHDKLILVSKVPTPTRKLGYTCCVEAALIVMDVLSLPPQRRTSTSTTLDYDTLYFGVGSRGGPHTYPLYRGRL